jgi:hypothetical protein
MMVFVRSALLLTFGALIVILPCAFCSGDPEIWNLIGPLCLVTVFLIWTITLSIGALVVLVVGIWKIARELHGRVGVKTKPHGRVWDRWMDGPEPLVP